MPDTGTLRGDLVTYVDRLAEQAAGQQGTVITGLFRMMRNDPELAARPQP